MKTKIKNWLEKHKYMYAVCLVISSLCLVAFGFATLGGNEPTDRAINAADLERSDEVASE